MAIGKPDHLSFLPHIKPSVVAVATAWFEPCKCSMALVREVCTARAFHNHGYHAEL